MNSGSAVKIGGINIREYAVISIISALFIVIFLYAAYRAKFSTLGYIGMFIAGSAVGGALAKGFVILMRNLEPEPEKLDFDTNPIQPTIN